MSTNTTTKCDVCQRQKAEVNHWFKVWTGTAVGVFSCCTAETYNALFDWYSYKDVCGLECATKLFQRFLDHGTLEP